MYILFADESGVIHDPQNRFFVLAGIALHEKSFYWLSNKLDSIAKGLFPDCPRDCEFHGNPMWQGKGRWRKFHVSERVRIMEDVLGLLNKVECSLFAVVLEKGSVREEDPVEYAFEQICSRFDLFLKRQYSITREKNQGLLVLDESSYEKTFQGLVKDFKEFGMRWGILHNISEVPLFVDSKASRFIQLADMVAYAVFRKYEAGDDTLFKIVSHKFDRERTTGKIHGLRVRYVRDEEA